MKTNKKQAMRNATAMAVAPASSTWVLFAEWETGKIHRARVMFFTNQCSCCGRLREWMPVVEMDHGLLQNVLHENYAILGYDHIDSLECDISDWSTEILHFWKTKNHCEQCHQCVSFDKKSEACLKNLLDAPERCTNKGCKSFEERK